MMTVDDMCWRSRFDMREFPVVRIKVPAILTHSAITRIVEGCQMACARGRFVLVIDLRALDTTRLTAKDRAEAATSADRVVVNHTDAIIAVAVIADTPERRGIYAAFLWMRRAREAPVRFFDTDSEAASWVEEALRKAIPSSKETSGPDKLGEPKPANPSAMARVGGVGGGARFDQKVGRTSESGSSPRNTYPCSRED